MAHMWCQDEQGSDAVPKQLQPQRPADVELQRQVRRRHHGGEQNPQHRQPHKTAERMRGRQQRLHDCAVGHLRLRQPAHPQLAE